MTINEEEILAGLISRKPAELADQIRFQLGEGKNNEGGWLLFYRDDPYFASVAQAMWYEEWKSKISPNPDKPRGVADFFIRGDFWSSIQARPRGLEVDYFSYSHIIDDVMQKTQGKALGMNQQTAVEYYNTYVHIGFVKQMQRMTGTGVGTKPYFT
jgi:hypothetical protein